MAQNIINTENRLEVAARLRSNSLAMGLKKTPKEKRVPARAIDVIRVIKTITHP